MKMNQKERQDFFNGLGTYLPKQDFIKLIESIGQLELKLTNLRKKAYSIEFAEKRVKTLYLNNPEFKDFIQNLRDEK
jgi:hypothetical protein